MKIILKPILKYYLKSLAKLVILIHRPLIIAVAGSTNKSFAKNEIGKRLQERGIKVEAGNKNFNTEIGLPLSILRLPESGYNSYRNWLPVIGKALRSIRQKDYPKVLILELGVSSPGDMRYLLSIIKPNVTVITDITQRYLESFSGMDNLVKEYKFLIKNTFSGGLVILNQDNNRVKNLAKIASAKVETFGMDATANCHIINLERGESGEKVFVSYKGQSFSHQLNMFGRHNVEAYLISLMVERFLTKEKT